MHDWGRIPVNKRAFLVSENCLEVHLHPGDGGAMAISPNNFVFLLDMSMQMVHFTLVLYDHDK